MVCLRNICVNTLHKGNSDVDDDDDVMMMMMMMMMMIKSPSPRCTLPCRGTTHASAVDGKKPRTVNFEKWRPSDSSSLAAAGWAIPQWTENIPSYSWDSDDD
jgi:hypothetical protein